MQLWLMGVKFNRVGYQSGQGQFYIQYLHLCPRSMSFYSIKVTPSQVMVPKIIKFPDTPSTNPTTKTKKVVTLSPSQNPSTPQFAFDLLQSQLQLDTNQNVNQKLITKLFQLYRLGIEYYNQRRSKKQFYFKKKLEALTNNPVVLGVLHECDTGTDTFYKKKQIEKMVEIDQKKSVHANQLLKSVFQSELKVESQLKNQSDLLQKRIQERRLIKKSCQGEETLKDSIIEEVAISPRKKLNRTMIVSSSNPEDDESKYFVSGAVISHEV